jgi:hypothetical protein
MSCRTGPLRAGRPLRGLCTGLDGPWSLGLAMLGVRFSRASLGLWDADLARQGIRVTK